MPLTESKGNMYPGFKTWNPLGGACMHACSYCSTNKLKRYPVIADKYSGIPRLYSDIFKLPKSPKLIFVAAQNDLFADNIPYQYIMRVLRACHKANQHTYFFQTKNPDRYNTFLFEFPKGSILCTTIETNRRYPQMGCAPFTSDRAVAMSQLTHFEKHVTIEPIMDFDLDEMVTLIRVCHPAKVNIGADSKHNNLPEPSKDKILSLIDELKKFTVIDRKTNLIRLLK